MQHIFLFLSSAHSDKGASSINMFPLKNTIIVALFVALAMKGANSLVWA